MASLPNDAASRYLAALQRADDELADRLSSIRRSQDAGRLTVREAADKRIEVMERHLAVTRRLREQHLGGGA
jgi:hypothetical protein